MPGPVIITGGGTGGHVFPMQAIAEQLRARGVAATDLRFVGSRRGQESQLLSGGPVALTLLPGRGLRRSMAPGAVLANLAASVTLVAAVAVALVRVALWRPAVVVSVGGYASFAVALAAIVWRRPLVLVDLDATPGAAHRLLGRFAARRCVAFASDDPRASVTGAPIRGAILAVARDPEARESRRASQVPPIEARRIVIVVMTGSLGSARVNEATTELAARWSDRADLCLIHVTGRRDFESVVRSRPETTGLDYRIIDFADMSVLWGLCDAAVCRAGALTIAELCALGIPAVLVPLPGAPHDHQTMNARALERAGAARVLDNDECTGESLASMLDTLVAPDTLEEVSRAARSLGHDAGAYAIASVVADVGRLA